MSQLSVYWPQECEQRSAMTFEAPAILKFPGRQVGSSPSGFSLDIVSRARTLFANRRCRCCGSPMVEPIELDDAAVNSAGLDIPGTATLVGFECQTCHANWSI